MRCSVVFALGVGLALAGCRRHTPPEEVVDGWALARKALTNGEQCFAARADYCITDPAFVDAAVQPRLDELYGGEMPPRKLYADAVVRAAVNEYRRAMMKPPNIARIEELVRERYHNPKVAIEGDEVVVDMGVVPGHIEPAVATLALRLAKSDLVENGSWKESEARRVLTTYAKKYPEKGRIRVAVTVVNAKGTMDVETFRYLRADKRLVVELGDGARVTPVLDGGDAALENVKLALDALEPCKVAPTGDEFACPTLPKPPSDD